jgi:glycosyltransferase involved in cell wall biosynthesis
VCVRGGDVSLRPVPFGLGTEPQGALGVGQKRDGLVSVTIPTRNAAATLGRCLESVRRQAYKAVEVLVVDGGSCDGTQEVAAAYGATVVEVKGGLLAARIAGAQMARGEYVLLLDADQVLAPGVLERAVAMAEEGGYDMLVLEEVSLPPRNFWQKLFAAHRRLIHFYLDEKALDPIKGTVLPRFFRRRLLLEAMDAIPEGLRKEVVHHDHAIIYLEARRLSSKVGILPRAVFHQEPASLREIVARNFRYGRSLAALEGPNPYSRLVRRRDGYIWPRGLAWRHLPLVVQSALLLTMLRAIQQAGLLWEKARRGALARPLRLRG